VDHSHSSTGRLVVFGGATCAPIWHLQTWGFVSYQLRVLSRGQHIPFIRCSTCALEAPSVISASTGRLVLFGGATCVPICKCHNDLWQFTLPEVRARTPFFFLLYYSHA